MSLIKTHPIKTTPQTHANLTEESPIYVDVRDIRAYEHNPRVTQNPKYEEIKSSIQAVGLMHEPVITLKPGEHKYVIRDGGNTRLAILNALFQETGDVKYKTIWCMYRPWESDLRHLTGHLSENENRGELSWLERSLAVTKAKKFYETDSGEMLSQRQLAKKLQADGYTIQHSHISKMLYTVEHLLATVPDVLYAGMGRTQVEKLIKHRQTCEQIWTTCGGDAEDFMELWHNAISPLDDTVVGLPWPMVEDKQLGLLARTFPHIHLNIFEMVIDNVMNARQLGLSQEQVFAPLMEYLEALDTADNNAITEVSTPSLTTEYSDTSIELATEIQESHDKEVEILVQPPVSNHQTLVSNEPESLSLNEGSACLASSATVVTPPQSLQKNISIHAKKLATAAKLAIQDTDSAVGYCMSAETPSDSDHLWVWQILNGLSTDDPHCAVSNEMLSSLLELLTLTQKARQLSQGGY